MRIVDGLEQALGAVQALFLKSVGHFDQGCPGLQEGDGLFRCADGPGTDDRKAVLGIFRAETDLGESWCHDSVKTGEKAVIQDARHLFFRVPWGDAEQDGAVFLVAEAEVQHLVQQRGPVRQIVQGRDAIIR